MAPLELSAGGVLGFLEFLFNGHFLLQPLGLGSVLIPVLLPVGKYTKSNLRRTVLVWAHHLRVQSIMVGEGMMAGAGHTKPTVSLQK